MEHRLTGVFDPNELFGIAPVVGVVNASEPKKGTADFRLAGVGRNTEDFMRPHRSSPGVQ
jgi:hypothetical protein